MKKTTLTVEITYDGRKTDAESLASAMDRLLETALSTPGIMDEYANPTIGEFFVAPKKVKTSKPCAPPKVVLSLSGGVLQDVFGSDPAMSVVLVDWDVDASDSSDDRIVEIPNGHGGTELAAVAECRVLPLMDLAGTDVEKAIEAAGLDQSDADDEAPETTRRWVIYDFDLKELATTTAYESYEEAAADANQLNNVLVLPLIVQCLIV